MGRIFIFEHLLTKNILKKNWVWAEFMVRNIFFKRDISHFASFSRSSSPVVLFPVVTPQGSAMAPQLRVFPPGGTPTGSASEPRPPSGFAFQGGSAKRLFL